MAYNLLLRPPGQRSVGNYLQVLFIDVYDRGAGGSRPVTSNQARGLENLTHLSSPCLLVHSPASLGSVTRVEEPSLPIEQEINHTLAQHLPLTSDWSFSSQELGVLCGESQTGKVPSHSRTRVWGDLPLRLPGPGHGKCELRHWSVWGGEQPGGARHTQCPTGSGYIIFYLCQHYWLDIINLG